MKKNYIPMNPPVRPLLKTYLLNRTNIEAIPKHCDTVDAAFAVAETPGKARKLVAAHAMDEGQDTWLNASTSICKEWKTPAKDGVVMLDKTTHS